MTALPVFVQKVILPRGSTGTFYLTNSASGPVHTLNQNKAKATEPAKILTEVHCAFVSH